MLRNEPREYEKSAMLAKALVEDGHFLAAELASAVKPAADGTDASLLEGAKSARLCRRMRS